MVMVYKTPSKNKSCDNINGFVEVDGKKIDYLVVAEAELAKTLKRGWYKTTIEAIKPPKKSLLTSD